MASAHAEPGTDDSAFRGLTELLVTDLGHVSTSLAFYLSRQIDWGTNPLFWSARKNVDISYNRGRKDATSGGFSLYIGLAASSDRSKSRIVTDWPT